VEELKRNGGVGYNGPTKVFTFDGNIEGKDTVEFEGMKLYQIANEAPNLDTIVKVCGVLHGQTIEVSGDEFETDSDSVGDVTFVIAYWKGSPFAMSAIADEISALYVHPGLRYIEFEGTVHTIDPKYLPEPVKINLADYDIDIVSATLAGGGTWVVYRPDFWDVVHANSDRDIRFTANMDGVDYQLFPSVIARGDVGGNVSLNLLACMSNVIINANVVFVHAISKGELIGVDCYVTVTRTPVPTLPGTQ